MANERHTRDTIVLNTGLERVPYAVISEGRTTWAYDYQGLVSYLRALPDLTLVRSDPGLVKNPNSILSKEKFSRLRKEMVRFPEGIEHFIDPELFSGKPVIP